MTRVLDLLDTCIDIGLTLFAPQNCNACQKATVARRSNGTVCAACWRAYRDFQKKHYPSCWRCGRWRRISEGAPSEAQRQAPNCDQCRHLSLDTVRSCGPYSGGLRHALLALKRHPIVPAPLHELIVEAWRTFPELHAADILTPTPLARRRERRRGYNQAALIADALARESGKRVANDALVRTAETEPRRAGMDDRARAQNIENAFLTLRPRLVEGKCVLIIDDVHTSGATINACAVVLRAAGAASVSAFTVARTMRYGG